MAVNRRKEKYVKIILTGRNLPSHLRKLDIFINFIMKGGEKMYNGLDWEVHEYGRIIQSDDMQISTHLVTTIIYVYKSNYYVETWINDVRYLFQPLD